MAATLLVDTCILYNQISSKTMSTNSKPDVVPGQPNLPKFYHYRFVRRALNKAAAAHVNTFPEAASQPVSSFTINKSHKTIKNIVAATQALATTRNAVNVLAAASHDSPCIVTNSQASEQSLTDQYIN
jgi:hypothetical protein